MTEVKIRGMITTMRIKDDSIEMGVTLAMDLKPIPLLLPLLYKEITIGFREIRQKITVQELG